MTPHTVHAWPHCSTTNHHSRYIALASPNDGCGVHLSVLKNTWPCHAIAVFISPSSSLPFRQPNSTQSEHNIRSDGGRRCRCGVVRRRCDAVRRRRRSRRRHRSFVVVFVVAIVRPSSSSSSPSFVRSSSSSSSLRRRFQIFVVSERLQRVGRRRRRKNESHCDCAQSTVSS